MLVKHFVSLFYISLFYFFDWCFQKWGNLHNNHFTSDIANDTIHHALQLKHKCFDFTHQNYKTGGIQFWSEIKRNMR